MLTYRPALIQNGDGAPEPSLRRAQRFVALMQDLADEQLLTRADEIVDEARDAAVADAEVAMAEKREPRTFDEYVGNVTESSVTSRPVLTGVEAFTAIIRGGKAGVFAAVMVQAIDVDGTVRDVTPEEADRDDFPTTAFAEAWPGFYRAAASLTSGLLSMPSATESS